MPTKRKQNTPMWVVRSSHRDEDESTRNVYLFPARPEISEDYDDWVTAETEEEGGEVCYVHWLAAAGLSLRKDKPVRVRFTARLLK